MVNRQHKIWWQEEDQMNWLVITADVCVLNFTITKYVLPESILKIQV